MIYKHLGIISTIIALVLIAGCKGEAGPAGPSLSGSISGIVQLYNSDGSMPFDRSGVTVSVQGTSLSTTTDSLGLWKINDVTTGSYTILETKSGYGMSEQQGFSFSGGSEDDYIPNQGYISLAQPPNFSVAIDSVKTIADSTLNIWFSMSGSFDTFGSYNVENDFWVLVGKDSNVNSADPSSYLYSDFASLSSQQGIHGSYTALISYLEYDGFSSGMTAYLVLYPFDHYVSDGPAYSSYYDIATQKTVYTSVGTPSKVLKVTIP